MYDDHTRIATVRWTPSRRFAAGTAAALAAIVWSHGLAALLRQIRPETPSPTAALGLSVAAVLVAAVGTWALPRRAAEAAAAGAGLLAAVVLELLAPGSFVGTAALVPVGALVTVGARWLTTRLPRSVDRPRTLAAAAWVLLAVVAVVQTGRLATAMTDHGRGLVLSTDHPFWSKHECIGAYLLAADLSARGEPDVYDPVHYAGLNPDADPDTRLEGVALDDPYQYPPQFLLLPRLALALTDHVPTIRVVWYALQTTLFVAIAVLLALWVGGPNGRAALWLLPLVMTSFPALHNFQFGQLHLPAVALAVAAMLSFQRRHSAVGGALLAMAVLAKIFPVVLLPYLAVQRRFRELAWTAAFVAVISLVALAVLGSAPFVAFVDSHLPRLADGSAFAFDEAWPELADLVVADNQGVFGLARKVGLDKQSAGRLGRVFGLAVLAVAALAGRRRASSSRTARAATWLALLGLASLASPGAWGDYVPVTAVWLLSLLAPAMSRGRLPASLLGGAWLSQLLVLGTMPLGQWAPTHLMIAVSAAGVVVMLSLYGTALAGRPSWLEARRAADDVPAAPQGLPRAA